VGARDGAIRLDFGAVGAEQGITSARTAWEQGL
jgi:hypothetical protein